MHFLCGWRIGRIVPAIIIVVFILDLALRFAPLEWLSFRSWEPMMQYHAPCAPFRSNAFYDNDRTYGGLAAIGNLFQFRQYHREIFSTDAYGFRRNGNGSRPNLTHRVIVLGDSMAVGLSVSDHQTLAARLEERLGFGVYNGGSPVDKSLALDQILELARRLEIKQGTVLYQYSGRGNLPGHAELFREATASCRKWHNRLSIWYDGFIETSPLQIFTQQILKYFQNDITLPNAFRSNVVVKKLAYGDSTLFFAPDVENFYRQRAADVSGVRALAEELTKHQLRFVVILIPDKYTVYEPLLKDAATTNSGEAIYYDQVEVILKAAKVPVANLTRFMRQKAKEAYQQNQLIFWHDDPHWNARGIELAAEEIIKQNLIH